MTGNFPPPNTGQFILPGGSMGRVESPSLGWAGASPQDLPSQRHPSPVSTDRHPHTLPGISCPRGYTLLRHLLFGRTPGLEAARFPFLSLSASTSVSLPW